MGKRRLAAGRVSHQSKHVELNGWVWDFNKCEVVAQVQMAAQRNRRPVNPGADDMWGLQGPSPAMQGEEGRNENIRGSNENIRHVTATHIWGTVDLLN